MLIENVYAESSDTIKIQESEALPKAPEQIQSSSWSTLIPVVLIFGVFYFLLIRPQDKRRRQQEELVGSVKKGEEVITNSGMFGVVTHINDSDNTVEVEIAKDTRIKMLKTAISDIVGRKKDSSKDAAKASKSKK
jgi:preprotein translocase subunit YajC